MLISRPCCRPWTSVLGYETILLPSLFCAQSHNTPTDTMDSVHILSRGSLYLVVHRPLQDGPLVNFRYSQSWVALTLTVKGYGNFCSRLVMFAKTEEFLASCPKQFSSFSQESKRSLYDLSSSPTLTERRQAAAGSSG